MVCNKCNTEISLDTKFLYNSEFSCSNCGNVIKSTKTAFDEKGTISRQEIKALARAAIKEQRGTAILLVFLLILLSFASSFLDIMVGLALGQGIIYWVVNIAGLFILTVIGINMLGEYYKIFNREDAKAGMLFSGLKINFFRKLGGALWMILWLCLWLLLLVVPGIIKGCSYTLRRISWLYTQMLLHVRR